MVKFVDVDPATIDTPSDTHGGKVSYPIIEGFMQRNTKVCKLDLEGTDKNPAHLRSVLYSYIRVHRQPIKLFTSGGNLHMMRLDMDDEGNIDPDWKPE